MSKLNKQDRIFLEKHPLCAVCMRCGKYKKATHVYVMTNGFKEARCDNHPVKILGQEESVCSES